MYLCVRKYSTATELPSLAVSSSLQCSSIIVFFGPMLLYNFCFAVKLRNLKSMLRPKIRDIMVAGTLSVKGALQRVVVVLKENTGKDDDVFV